MAGEVAGKKMNFLPVIPFQALPIPVSGETVKDIQPRDKGVAADPDLPVFKRGNIPKPVLQPHGRCVSVPRAVGSRG